MKALFALFLLVPMTSLAADPWLCIGEKGASVTTNDYSVVGSESFRNEDKWLINEKGLQFFGGALIFDKCYYHEGRPTSCELENPDAWAGYFSMNPGNVFTVVFFQVDGDNVSMYTIAGKCSKL